MTVNEKILKALGAFTLPVEPDIYDGDETEYFTFNYADDRATEFADDCPTHVVAYMQIHYFLPLGKNHLAMKKRIRDALFGEGFTYPEVTVLTEPENKIKHLVFECEIENEEELEE